MAPFLRCFPPQRDAVGVVANESALLLYGKAIEPLAEQVLLGGRQLVAALAQDGTECDGSGGDTMAQHRAAVDAARAAGVKRVVYTSHMAASASSHFLAAHDHAATEELLRQSGLAWTSLRNGFYATSGLLMMGDALETGLVEAPRDGKVSWTAPADLAEGAAVILADEDASTVPLRR